MSSPTQETRTLGIETPLGKDVLVLQSFSGQEEMSRLFVFQLEMLSARDFISPREIVGKNVTFHVRRGDGSPRYFNGFVSRFVAGDRQAGMRRYFAEVVPWLWFLTRTADCRIFQNKNAPDIIQQVFQDLGFSDFESQLNGNHPVREYCVQYRETDFHFVSRLMEDEGIFYFFRHEAGKHVLVMADHKGAYKDCPESQVEYEYSYSEAPAEGRISRWEHQFEFIPGKWAQTDYNFIDHPARSEPTPSNLLMTREQSGVPVDQVQKYEVYDYPGDYQKKSDGQHLTDVRMEGEETWFDVVQGESRCKTFSPGGKFKIKRHDCQAEEGKGFVLIAVHHSASEPTEYGSPGGAAGEYSNRFTCIPDSVPFRPRRITPKPRIHGSQTAVVTGPKGEEIWPDKYGRVKVQFFWDREGRRDEKTTCWIRCAQTIAGKNWGAMFIPRIGQEVVVTYLEGDPDRPLITGVVYNADQMPPYPLPDEKTKSCIKTNSTKGGEGFNEIRFEDKKDQEQIFIHAQRDMDLRVLRDSREHVIANSHQIVGSEKDGGKQGDRHEMVFRDKHVKIHRNQEEQIGGNLKLLIGGIDGDGNADVVIKGEHRELVEKDQHHHVKGNRMEKIDVDQSLTVGMSQQEKVGTKHALEAGQEIHLKAGMKVVIEAGLQLTLKGAGGFVDIGPTGVTIQGTLVNINSGGAPGAGSGSQPSSPQDAQEAKPVEPDEADDAKTGQKSAPW